MRRTGGETQAVAYLADPTWQRSLDDAREIALHTESLRLPHGITRRSVARRVLIEIACGQQFLLEGLTCPPKLEG